MGNQFPRSVVEKAHEMQKVHFKTWGWGFKCYHCPKMVEWSITDATYHYKTKHRATKAGGSEVE